MPQIITGQDAEAAFAAAGGAVEQATVASAKAELLEEQQAAAPQGEPSLAPIETGGGDGLILGKFKSQEDLAKAYTELEKKLGKGGGEPESQAEPGPQDQDQEEEDEEGSAPALSDQEALQLKTQLLEAAGGEQGFARLAAWARGNVDPSVVATFNQALEQGKANVAVTVLKAMQYDYLQANGYEPELIGGRQVSSGAQPFRSEAEVKAAMSDPRYMGPGADPAYIEDVRARLAQSPDVFRFS